VQRVYELADRGGRGLRVVREQVLVERGAHARGERLHAQAARGGRAREQAGRAFVDESLRLCVCLTHGGFS
jgi:hypothetical protein